MFVEEMHCPINVCVQLLLCKGSVEGSFHYTYVCCGNSLHPLTPSHGSLPMDELMDAPIIHAVLMVSSHHFQW